MSRWLSLVALLGGCDKLFSLDELDHVTPVSDAFEPDANDPMLDKWRATTSLPVGRDYNHSHAALVDDTLFMVGGFDTVVGLETDVVYRATVTDGEVGAWSTTTSLPQGRAFGDVVTIGQRLYLVGGAYYSGAQTSVYVADVTSGMIDSWSATTALPVPSKAQGAVAVNGYLYSIGGGDATNDRHAEVYVAPVLSSGSLGSWQATTALPAPRANLSVVSARGFIYAIGGDDEQVELTTTVYVAMPDADTGDVGSWLTTTPLPTPRRGFVALTDGRHIYVIGGETSGGAIGEVLYSEIAGDGTIGPWQPTEPLLLPRYRHAGVLANGNLFVLGGATTTTSVEHSSQHVP
jgi:N-acetylneuraminic acid mutarotase